MRNTRSNQEGQSLVEFALSLMFILLLLSGVVDLGRAFFTYMDLREAAQEGASYGAINPSNDQLIRDRVLMSSNAMQNSTVGNGDIDIQYLGAKCAGAGNGIRVTVNISGFPITMPFLGTIIGSQTIGISASATDTILAPLCT